MRRIEALLIVLIAAFSSVPTASAGEAAVPEETVSGRIVDITCYGPCAPGTDPRPFGGEADVVVTDRRSGLEVARVPVTGPRYSVLVPPGRYRIVALPYPQMPTGCWQGMERRLHVVAGQAERRRLKVENVCVQ